MSPSERSVQFSSPTWLRNLGFSSWLLVGFVLIIVGLIWLLAETSTIVMPVILATVLGAVAGPAVGWLEGHSVPRIWGAILVLLGLVAIGVLIFCLVFGGISAQSDDISAKANQALDTIQGWLADVGVDNPQKATEGVQETAPDVRTTLLSGVAVGIEGLKSLVFFLAFAVLSTLFVLKDGPVMRAFINRHMGIPQRDAAIVTDSIAKSLRSYFLAVTIIAAFNAIVIGGTALILGVPLAGTIAVVTFVGAYVPFVGAWVAGGFAVMIALGAGSTPDAAILAIVCLLANGILQQMIQPFVMGATLSLNPLVVLVVTIGAGALFGMVGLTLAAPLTSAAVHIATNCEPATKARRQARRSPRPHHPARSSQPDISSQRGDAPNAIGRWNALMTRTRLGLLVAGLLLIAALAVGCGESDAEKAQNQVCDARDDINKQVNELAALTPSTATTEGVQGNLDAIKNDLNDIKDAQGDLNEDRKQEVESANQEFSSQVQAVASDLGTSLSASGAEAKLQSAGAELKSAYQQTFAKVDCS